MKKDKLSIKQISKGLKEVKEMLEEGELLFKSMNESIVKLLAIELEKEKEFIEYEKAA
jgi:Trm5-related predicted tRNA methylase